jgi:hypothetical protein
MIAPTHDPTQLRERADEARTEAQLTADPNVLEQKIALVTGGSTWHWPGGG